MEIVKRNRFRGSETRVGRNQDSVLAMLHFRYLLGIQKAMSQRQLEGPWSGHKFACYAHMVFMKMDTIT